MVVTWSGEHATASHTAALHVHAYIHSYITTSVCCLVWMLVHIIKAPFTVSDPRVVCLQLWLVASVPASASKLECVCMYVCLLEYVPVLYVLEHRALICHTYIPS